MFTKRHYVKIAKLLNLWTDSTGKINAQAIMANLADMFEEDNPHFNRAKFIDACTKHDSTGESLGG